MTIQTILAGSAPYIIGAVSSYVFIRYRLQTSELQSSINDHIKDIERFTDTSLAYWLKGSSDINLETERAAFVRSQHFRLAQTYPDIAAMCKKQGNVYKALMIDLFDLATGGTFETFKRPINAERAVELAEKSTETIVFLRKIRRESLTVNYRLFGNLFSKSGR